MDHYATEGCVTAGDEMRITQPASLGQFCAPETQLKTPWTSTDLDDPLQPLSLGYIKGMLRSCPIHSVLSWCKDHGHDIRTCHPQLYASLLRIYVVFTPKNSKREEATENFIISCRGSIRRAPDLLAILYMILNLRDSGDRDYIGFVKALNSKAARCHQITGSKASDLRLLVESLDRHVLDLLMDHVSRHGWSNAWTSEDNLASKKLYPPHQHRTTSKNGSHA